MKIAVLTDGKAPIPATKGGAVENLIQLLLNENEKQRKFEFFVFSLFEKNAYEESFKYKESKFKFVKCPSPIDLLDRGIYLFAKNVLKKRNLISYRYILRRLYVMSKYPQLLLSDTFDRVLIVTNSTLFLVFKNKKVFRKYQNKVFFYLHNEVRSLFGCTREIASIRGLIGISKFVNEAFRKQIPSLDETKCYLLKNCIDRNCFLDDDSEKVNMYKRRFAIGENDYVVLFAGRLVEEKGALEVIEAVKACNRSNIKLLIIGSGFYTSDVTDDYQLRLYEAALPIQDRIIFTGYIDYADMPYIYRLGDVAVLPSIWDEPAGMTMVEAVVSGLPLITTISGGIPEYIPQDAAVFLDRNSSLVENITHAICKIMDDQDFANTLVRNGTVLKDELHQVNFYQNFADIIVN